MDHRDHVRLIEGGVDSRPTAGRLWLELGAGEGTFTLALADVLGPGGAGRSRTQTGTPGWAMDGCPDGCTIPVMVPCCLAGP